MHISTTDLCDAHIDQLQVAEPRFVDFGGSSHFAGPISTVKTFEDNVLVRAALESPGEGRVLVVDGGGSLRRALVGDILAGLGIENGWVGIVVNGCVRDTGVTRGMEIGIKALAALPHRSEKVGIGQRDVPVSFAGVTFRPGEWLYADPDGIIVAPTALHQS